MQVRVNSNVEKLWKTRFIHRRKQLYIGKNVLLLIGLPWHTNIILIIGLNLREVFYF